MGKEETIRLVEQELNKPDTYLFKEYQQKLTVLVPLGRKMECLRITI